MPELSPLAFAAAVLAVVAITMIVPRLRSRSEKQTTHDLYFGRVPSRPAPATGHESPAGAPRAPSPVRTSGVPGPETPEPPKLPVYR